MFITLTCNLLLLNNITLFHTHLTFKYYHLLVENVEIQNDKAQSWKMVKK